MRKFILHAREQLMKHQKLAQYQNSLVTSVSLVDDGRDDSDDEYADHEQTPVKMRKVMEMILIQHLKMKMMMNNNHF